MKLLALVEERDHVCCRYRIRAFEPALAAAGSALTCEGLDRRSVFPSDSTSSGAATIGAVVLQRKLLPSWQLQRAAAGCAAPGVRLRRRGLISRLLFSSEPA